jgi:hypothetical protein
VSRAVFFMALERGFLDGLSDRFVIAPFQRLANRLSRFDRWLCDVVLPTRLPRPIDGGTPDE